MRRSGWNFLCVGAALVTLTHGMPMISADGRHHMHQFVHQYNLSYLYASNTQFNFGQSVEHSQSGQSKTHFQTGPNDRFSQGSGLHGFTDWASWGGQWTSDPQSASLHGDELDVFTVGVDGYIYYRSEHHGNLHHWTKIYGATAKFPPAVAVQQDGSIDIVIHGSDDVIYYARRDPGGAWKSFESLHFRSYRRPGVAPWSRNGLFVFSIGTDGQMYKLERRHEKWPKEELRRDWVCLGGSWSGGVTGGHISGEKFSHNVYVLAYDKYGFLHYAQFYVDNSYSQPSNWLGHWSKLHVQGTFTPVLSTRSNGFDIVIRTSNGQIAVNSYSLHDNGWTGWVHFRFTTYTVPGIASHAAGFLYLFALDHNHQLHVCHRQHQGANFNAWHRLGGPYTSSPSAIVRENRFIDVFILNRFHALVLLGARLQRVLVGL